MIIGIILYLIICFCILNTNIYGVVGILLLSIVNEWIRRKMIKKRIIKTVIKRCEDCIEIHRCYSQQRKCDICRGDLI